MEELKEAVEEDAELNMTPMIDVVFLLIIFFLCIDFKILEAKLPAHLPKDRGSQSTKTEPIEQLSIQIVCTVRGNEVRRDPNEKISDADVALGVTPSYYLQGHTIHWMVGPKKVDTQKELLEALQEIADDPSRRVADKDTGGTKIMPVVIEPLPNAVYKDVAETVDTVSQAGFEEINFGGGIGGPKGAK